MAFTASLDAAPRQVDLILTGGTVITMDGAHRVLRPGAIAVQESDLAQLCAGSWPVLRVTRAPVPDPGCDRPVI